MHALKLFTESHAFGLCASCVEIAADHWSPLHSHDRSGLGDPRRLQIFQKSVDVAPVAHETVFDEPQPIFARPSGLLVLVRELEDRLAVLVLDMGLEPAPLIEIHDQGQFLPEGFERAHYSSPLAANDVA